MVQHVENTSMYLLDKSPMWKNVKPYELKFNPPTGFPKTNAVPRKREGIAVEDIRGREQEFSVDKNGFALINLDASITFQNFESEDGEYLAKYYFKPLANALKSLLGADRVQIFDFQVRKSHPEFPISTGDPYAFQQPSTILHIDTTPTLTKMLVKQFNPDAPELANLRHQYVNVWKPLKGPVKSWPLCVCDNRTVNPEKDLQARDIVYPEGAVESYQVHFSSTHRFYYLSEQQTNEAWVMLQSDSGGLIGTPHTAFPNPWSGKDIEGRESVEVRALVFYQDSSVK